MNHRHHLHHYLEFVQPWFSVSFWPRKNSFGGSQSSPLPAFLVFHCPQWLTSFLASVCLMNKGNAILQEIPLLPYCCSGNETNNHNNLSGLHSASTAFSCGHRDIYISTFPRHSSMENWQLGIVSNSLTLSKCRNKLLMLIPQKKESVPVVLFSRL